MRRFYNFSHGVINLFWRLLFYLMLFFALTSPNIIIGDNATFGTSTTMVTTGLVLTIGAICVMIYAYPGIRAWFYKVFVTRKLMTGSLMLVAILILQILFIYFVHPNSGFDSGMLVHAATDKTSAWDQDITSYFSLNQNNLPIMLFMHWLSVSFHQTQWIFFDYVTLLFVDLSAVFNLLSVYVVRRRALGVAIYMTCGWLAVFPSIIMPYTDAWVLPLVSLFMLCYFTMRSDKMPFGFQAAAAVGFGVSVVLTYFMKPSSIIPVIAIVIVEFLAWMVQKRHFTAYRVFLTLALSVLIVDSASETYKIVHHKVESQTYLKIDKSLSIPAIHFMAMGVYDQGGYSWRQALAMVYLPTEKQKTDYSVKMLKKRLKKLGPLGYAKFLVMKQRNNTADGTFGWLKEGHFFLDNQKPKQNGITNQLKNYIYLYGEHIADFRFAAQFWWITLLVIIALGFGPRQNLIQVLRLSMVGGFMFLLLFEGGRSRYLIQYLPCLLLLSIFSFERVVANMKRLFGWYDRELEKDTAKFSENS